MIAISPAFDLLSVAGQRRYLEAHLKEALIDLRLAHPAHKGPCNERVNALLHKMAEIGD